MQEECSVTEPRKSKTIWKVFDLTYVILVIAVMLAISYSIKVSRQNAALQMREREYSGTLSGPQTAQEKDTVPAFKTVDLQERRTEILYDGTKRFLFFIFSPMCGTCQHEVPLWNALVPIAISKNIAVHGISIESLEDSKMNIAGKDISFDILIMPDMPTRRAYRVVSIPQVMLTSEHGRVQWVHYGAMTQDKIIELQSKLNERE